MLSFKCYGLQQGLRLTGLGARQRLIRTTGITCASDAFRLGMRGSSGSRAVKLQLRPGLSLSRSRPPKAAETHRCKDAQNSLFCFFEAANASCTIREKRAATGHLCQAAPACHDHGEIQATGLAEGETIICKNLETSEASRLCLGCLFGIRNKAPAKSRSMFGQAKS